MENSKAFIRKARSGEEAAIHKAHMRSIREICIKDHGEEEIKGWGFRPLGERWIEVIKNDDVWVVEYNCQIHGVGYMKLVEKDEKRFAYIHALYFTPEVTGLGLAKKILEKFFEAAREWKVELIKLDSSITAYKFYKRHGFQDNGNMAKVEIGGHQVTTYPMICDLKT